MSSISHVSSIAELASPIAVCCHDAGAANLVAAWVADVPSRDVRICAEGPAAPIFARAAPDRALVPLEKALAGARCLLSGSGWASDLEHRARLEAKQQGIAAVAVLDHWVNYRARFSRGGLEVLPDLLIVADREAQALAEQEFAGECPVVLWNNRYLETEVAKVRASSPGANVREERLLVLLEPIRQDWDEQASQAAEVRALEFLLANLHAIFARPGEVQARLRPHPSEAPSKYRDWLQSRKLPHWRLSSSPSLAEDIAWSSVAAGLNSYALVVALEARRRAVSYLPPGAPPCPLRHVRLEHLTALAGVAP